MFTNTNNNAIRLAICENRDGKNAVKLNRADPCHVQYKTDVEELRLAVSRLAASTIQSHDPERVCEFRLAVSRTFRAVLIDLGEPLFQTSVADIESVLTIVGTFRTVDGRKTFTPCSENTFRMRLEKIFAIRAAKEIVKDADTIKAEKKARRKARKEAKQQVNAPALLTAGIIESTAVEIV